MDALPRTFLALGIFDCMMAVLSIRREEPQDELLWFRAMSFWVVHLLVLPHGKHDGGDLARHGNPSQVGLGAVGHESIVVCPQRVVGHTGNHGHGRTLEDGLGMSVEVVVQTTGLYQLRSSQLAVGPSNPVGRGTLHYGQPTVRPELPAGAEPVGSDHDGQKLGRANGTNAGGGLQNTVDRMPLRFGHHVLVCFQLQNVAA